MGGHAQVAAAAVQHDMASNLSDDAGRIDAQSGHGGHEGGAASAYTASGPAHGRPIYWSTYRRNEDGTLDVGPGWSGNNYDTYTAESTRNIYNVFHDPSPYPCNTCYRNHWERFFPLHNSSSLKRFGGNEQSKVIMVLGPKALDGSNAERAAEKEKARVYCKRFNNYICTAIIAGLQRLLAVQLQDPRDLRTSFNKADFQAIFTTRIPSLDCDVGGDWSYQRDERVPSRFFLKRKLRLQKAVVNAIARFDRKYQLGTLDVTAALPTTTISTSVNTKQELGPVRVAAGFDVDGRNVDVVLVHDLAARSGAMSVAAALFICSVDAVPIIKQGLDAFGTNFASAKVIISREETSVLSIGVNDKLEAIWNFQTVFEGRVCALLQFRIALLI
ncbi:hypothetical protein JKP88DRAFT_267273 [Tribonema minus]|uniref:Uncharacterized protein n=1 Tax=Tribonema minus TaxID=303371 RepID=A0A835ZFB5_9STRA|nr:hypothetical protein JKP88DRAFT_267273 [Tribonema minus]